jgi:hypothetical protein
VGSEDYGKWSRIECRALINQIRRVLGPEPEGAGLRVRSNPHDFGTYYEVACEFDDSCEKAINYAFDCEAGKMGVVWDEEALAELKEAGYPMEKP